MLIAIIVRLLCSQITPGKTELVNGIQMCESSNSLHPIHSNISNGLLPKPIDAHKDGFRRRSKGEKAPKRKRRVSKLSCDECKKTFRDRGNLNVHLRTHSGVKPFMCRFCGMCFSQNGNMQRHIRRLHSKINHEPKVDINDTVESATQNTLETWENGNL